MSKLDSLHRGLGSNSAGDILESILRIGPGDVLVGISFPRYSKATVKGVQFAHDRGADVVAVTR